MLSLVQSFVLILFVPLSLASPKEYQFHESPLELSSGLQAASNGTDGVIGGGHEFKILAAGVSNSSSTARYPFVVEAASAIPLDGYTRIIDLNIANKPWTVWEDLSQINGNLVFASASGEQRVFPKYAESFNPQASAQFPRYMGRSIREVGLALDDLLATDLLRTGEPSEEQVKWTIPGLTQGPVWTSFVGNVQANDVVAIFPQGSTKSFQVGHAMPDFFRYARSNRYDGYLGGWMPAVRKVFAVSATDWFETTAFGDVKDKDPFIVPTWHRTVRIKNGRVSQVAFGRSYPTFTRVQGGPKPESFYTALFNFGDYWNQHLKDKVQMNLPDNSWTDMTTYAFVKELLIRPGGVYPKYGAFERDYAGSEYSGFQDIFTSSLSSNLEWGRFDQAKAVLDNYYDLMTDDEGNINMRGPEVGQFGLSLSLIAKYAYYTGDIATLEKHKKRIIATAVQLVRLHDESLALSPSDRGYGILHGWSESDACLKRDPALYWKPYYGNSALGARGLKDIASLPMFSVQAADWNRRADMLVNRTVESVRANILPGTTPPYVPPMPGVRQTFRQAMAAAPGNSEQDWPHRLYAELLHGNILPQDLQNAVMDTVRAYGATSMGVIANVAPTPSPATRDILGFISYGQALALLYLDRIDEFVLFMFSHRYHVHSRGAWNAGEVTGTAGVASAFCQPAQATIPIIVRWALVLEDQDGDRLYLGRGVPRAWLGSGKEISIKGAPTRWGRVDYAIQFSQGKVVARVKFLGERMPVDFEVKMRVPQGTTVRSVTVNGKPSQLAGKEGVFVKAKSGVKEYVVEATL